MWQLLLLFGGCLYSVDSPMGVLLCAEDDADALNHVAVLTV
jgi:hypothetical protein